VKRYDSTTTIEPRHVTIAEHAIGAAFGLAAFTALLCVLAGMEARIAWKPVLASAVIPLTLAGVGALVRVVEFVLPKAETRLGFDLNGDGTVGENIRIIPVHHNQNVSMSGSDSKIDADDLRYMIERLDMDAQSG